MVEIRFAATAEAAWPHAYAVAAGGRLPPATAAADAGLGGAIARAVADAGFQGGAEQAVVLVADSPAGARPLVLVGTGEAMPADAAAWRVLAGRAVRAATKAGYGTLALGLGAAGADLAEAAYGVRLAAHADERYRRRRAEDPARLEEAVLLAEKPAAARRAWAALAERAAGVELARELVNDPANVLNPVAFVERASTVVAHGVDVRAFGPAHLRAQGFGAMMAVAQGSANEPRLLEMRWMGSPDPAAAPIAFVGKGLTFDSGGISIKPAAGMERMKYDMAGGAAVVGTLRALAGRKAPVNAVGVVGLAENMPSESSYRPGDVVRSLSGQTIEVVDTDAEGRMVLADVLCHTARAFRPSAMIDLATLTGSIVSGLGRVYSGLFASDEALAADLLAASAAQGERLWRMPLHPDYEANLKSDIADLRQCAPDDAYGDAPHAAQFLSRFVEGVPWAHLDIPAGAYVKAETPLVRGLGTGFGVALLDALADRRARRGKARR